MRLTSKSPEKFPSKEIQFNFLLTQCFPLVYPGNHFKNNYNDVIASIILPNTLHILANTVVRQNATSGGSVGHRPSPFRPL